MIQAVGLGDSGDSSGGGLGEGGREGGRAETAGKWVPSMGGPRCVYVCLCVFRSPLISVSNDEEV